MTKMIFYDVKSYDRTNFDRLKDRYQVDITYVEPLLNQHTAALAKGYDVVCAFVNDTLDRPTVDRLYAEGVKLIAMRCAGYNNVDIAATCGRIPVIRVPAYSPHAVAEHALALLMTLDRKTNHAWLRTKEFNFSLEGLVGFDLYGKTAGVIGTGKIGRAFIQILQGLGMKVLASDPYPSDIPGVTYTDIPTLLASSDVVSLHCPLTKDNHHLIDEKAIETMKPGAILINTSRGGLIDSKALLKGLREGRLGGAGLDVYEEERDLFYKDNSQTIVQDDTLSLLIALPNVIVTSHQGFLTDDALAKIAETTLSGVAAWRDEGKLENQVCLDCTKPVSPSCFKNDTK